MASVSVISTAQLQSMKKLVWPQRRSCKMKTFFWPEHVRANDYGCQQIAPPESSEKTKYLLDLHERSKQRADRWPNTLDVRGL